MCQVLFQVAGETALDKTEPLPSAAATTAEGKADHVRIMSALSEVDSQGRDVLRRELSRLGRGRTQRHGGGRGQEKQGRLGDIEGREGPRSLTHRRHLDFTRCK